ncbi:MAG: hypothetical protein AVDCRST_MAG56-4292 [uncultured Cytophagales bacterium]|uniref:Uncharacterized protein n=1 Tax=uncultured Cytophagales bacterium TaxID=158755 RepID=A0A6J4JTN3_9SPHI|nr:MAG: hypothetical protein AVDCRST_MAG56-4292 [uncultured Cytophagales bacterium]
MNIWGISENTGDGISCPIVPARAAWYKKLFLFFFRFGICPLCVTMSVTYAVARLFKRLAGRSFARRVDGSPGALDKIV